MVIKNTTMEKGIIKFYNAQQGFGFITKEDGSDIFFHISNAQSELSVLLLNGKATKEPVVFDLKDSEKKGGQKEATCVSLNTEKRKVGYIKKEDRPYNQELFFIKDYYSDDMYFLHPSNLRKAYADKYVSFEVEDPVLFSPCKNDKGGLLAEDVVLVDNRSFIQGFAEFTDFEKAINDLAATCETESWDYINSTSNISHPILRSYISHTCERICEQNKLFTETSSQGEKYAIFNTGLVNKFQDEIFAYFVKNRNYTDNQPWGIRVPEWWFLEFNTDQSQYRKYFDEVPEIATYLNEADNGKLVFDTTISIRPNWDHLNKRKHRIYSDDIRNMTEQEFRDAIQDSISMATKRIKRNYKTAIPHYYNGDIQFLVPLCERKDRSKPIAAMVMQKSEKIYEVTTILTLDQAYNDARLLAKPDREWLNP